MRALGLAWLLLIASPPARADDDEHVISPYYVVHGPRDAVELAEHHEALAADARAAGDPAREARHLALACAWRSNLDGQLIAGPCPRARQLAETLGLLDVELVFEVAEANVALASMDVARAVPLYLDVIERGRAIDPDSPEAQPVRGAHVLLAIARIFEGRFDEWLAELTAAHRMSDGRDAWESAAADLWLCWGYPQMGDLVRARQACDRLQAYVDATGDWSLGMWLAFTVGELESWSGRDEAALAAYQRALLLAQRRGGLSRRVVTRAVIASMLIRLGRFEEARQNLEAAGDDVPAVVLAFYRPLLEQQWGRLEHARGNFAAAAAHFEVSKHSPEREVAIGGYRGLAGARRRQGDLPGAQAALEELIQVIEAERLTVDGASQRASFFAIHWAAYADLVGILYDRSGAAAAARALDVAEAGRARALLDALAVAQVAGTAAQPRGAAEIQARLGGGEVLVEYVSADDRLLAITVTRDQVGLVTLPGAGSAADLAERVAFFRQLVEETGAEAALSSPAARLYADILAPALTLAPPAAHTLIVAADGPLQLLPFDALVDGTAPLLDRWDITMVPSASVLASRPEHGAPLAAALVVAAPDVASLGALPAARAEADAVRRRIAGDVTVLAGDDASEARLAQVGVERFAVLHFASHALVDEALPLRSALLLAGGGMWRAEEIYRLALRADLVVLSACGTAAGARSGGEGTMSLSRAFLSAGAGATVATLWDVDDAPGPAFADALYRRIGESVPLGAAVAGAKRELRQRGAPPRAWASYLLTGSPRGHVRVAAAPEAPVRLSWIAGGLAALGLAAGLAWITRRRPRWLLFPAAGAAVAAVLLFVLWPASLPPLGAAGSVHRGSAAASVEITASAERITWRPVAQADEYRVAFFQPDGRPLAPPGPAASPVAVPAAARGGWLRVEAWGRGLRLAASPLVSL